MNYRSSEDGNIMVTVLVTQDGERHTETRSFPGFSRTPITGFESRLSLLNSPDFTGVPVGQGFLIACYYSRNI